MPQMQGNTLEISLNFQFGHAPASQTSQWSCACKFPARSRTVFQCKKQEKNVCKKPCQVCKFLKQVDLYKILIQFL